MNKQEFNVIVRNPKTLKEDDIASIELLEKKYPYSQVLHTLSALGTRRYKSSQANAKLTQAAVYATDRLVLKNYITTGGVQVAAKPVVKPAPKPSKPEAAAPAKKEKVASTPAPALAKKPAPKPKVAEAPQRHPGLLSESEADTLREEVIKNLEELLEIKKLFLESTSSSTAKKKSTAKKPAAKKTATAKKVTTKKATPAKKATAVKKSTATKTASAAAKKATNKASTTTSTKKQTATTSTKTTKTTKTKAESSIKNLKVTKSATKEPKKKSPTTKAKDPKEQQELIDKFIEKKPSIRKKKEETVPDNQDDLAKSSVAFGDHLVSENLAKVMVKQGKISKAIDIYKKLIWKFPQKKAYFASQIESLKGK